MDGQNWSLFQRSIELAADAPGWSTDPLPSRYTVLTNEQRGEVLKRLAVGEKVKRLAGEFSVDRKTIRNIRDKAA